MKKVLLLTMATFIFAGVYSQMGNIIKAEKKTVIDEPAYVSKDNQGSTADQNDFLHKSVKSGEVEKVVINMSGNIYGSLFSRSAPIYYNSDLDLLIYTFRANPAIHTEAHTSGTIMACYSDDRGDTWSEPCYISNPDVASGYNNRFPNGAIYNPDGNTNVDDAYIVSAGPSHGGSVWYWIYSGSSTTQCANNYNEFFDCDMTGGDLGSYLSGRGLTIYGDDAHYLYFKIDDFSTVNMEMVDMVGEWNADHFEFEEGESVDLGDLLTKDVDGMLNWRGNYTGGDNGIEFAWSKDMQTGYFYVIAQSQEVMMGMQPVVFKTTDGGGEWSEIDIDFEDYEDFFEEWMPASTEGPITPRFNESVAAVDANGNLQILGACTGSSTLDPDSVAAWGYNQLFTCLYNVEITDAGVNNVIWIDSIYTDVVDDEDGCAYAAGSSPHGWNHRLGITKSVDETKIFFTWVNDYYDENGDVCAPDIFGTWRRIEEPILETVMPVSFTEGTDFEGLNFFSYAANFAYTSIDNDTTWYHIPFTQTLTPVEYLTNTDVDPVTHHYVKGIEFGTLLTSSNEQIAESGFSVSQNTPNPASGNTTIEFMLNEQENVSIKLTNIIGQTVYENDLGTFNIGLNRTQINISEYESGVYFYTVKAGVNSVTKKMIIE